MSGQVISAGNEKAEMLLARFRRHYERRLLWNTQWQEVNDLVRPNTAMFTRYQPQGYPRTRRIYDGTAMLSCIESGGYVQSYLCNSTERWFNISSTEPDILDDDDSLAWMEIVSDLIYLNLSIPKVRFVDTSKNVFEDELGYGTACAFQDFNWKMMQLRFRSLPLTNIYLEEGSDGNVNGMFRTIEWNYDQARQEFGKQTPSELKERGEKNPNQKFLFLHAVLPREAFDPRNPNAKNMTWASYWLWIGGPATDWTQVGIGAPAGKPVLIKEGGFRLFPYHTPRWDTQSGEIWGRGPGISLMPTIKMLNQVSKHLVASMEKVIDPPILAPDDFFVGALKTTPGQLVRYDAALGPAQQYVMPLNNGGQIKVGIEFLDRWSQYIERGFMLPYFRAARKAERQSVPEIQDDRNEMLRGIAPMLGRQESEYLGPVLWRTYDCLMAAGLIPPAPPKLQRRSLGIFYTSAATRAQISGKATAITQWLQTLTPLIEVAPETKDVMNTDEAARQLAFYMDVSRKVINGRRDIAEIRKQRQQQAQMQQMAEMGMNASQAVKNVAQAQQASAMAGQM